MARIKRRANARNHQGIKHRRRKSDIPELVYKFLVASGAVRGAAERSGIARATECRCHDAPDEVVDAADPPRIAGCAMGSRGRRDSHTGRIAKRAPRGVKGRPADDLPISYLQDCVGSEGRKRARRYIKKALDFGIEAGYLIPSDSACKILRVSSDLMKSDQRRSRYDASDNKALSQERDESPRDVSPSKLEDLQVQEQRRRRRRRRRRGRGRRSRSRSNSRRRVRGRRRRSRRSGRRRRMRSRSRSGGRRRYASPQNPEEVVEDDGANDCDMDENEPKSDVRADDTEKQLKTTAGSKSRDEEQSTLKDEENGSDLSVDEDETDDEEERKSASATKS